MAAKKILIADDESRMRKLIKDYLRRDGFEVIEAADGLEALAQFDLNPDTDLIIMDVMMPKLDGYGALKKIREKSKVPVIILTAKSEEEDALEGFTAGADEFVTKPFSPKVLVARVKAIINRGEGGTGSLGENNGKMTCGKITLDENAHTVTADGRDVTLSVKEFDLLAYFMCRPLRIWRWTAP